MTIPIKYTALSVLLLAACCLPLWAAAALGRATAEFDNSRPQRSETDWGRFAADALRRATGADIALLNAGALQRGVLPAGDVTQAQVNRLLTFPGDDIVTFTLTGAQLRAALERAVHAYPTGSTAFLHGSGYTAAFNTQAPTNNRLTMLRLNGREVQNSDSIRAAMPAGLAQGGAGYFTIWNGDNAQKHSASFSATIAAHIRASGQIAPDRQPRLAPQ